MRLNRSVSKKICNLIDQVASARTNGIENIEFKIKGKESDSVLVNLIEESRLWRYISVKQVVRGVILSEMRFAQHFNNRCTFIVPYYLETKNGDIIENKSGIIRPNCNDDTAKKHIDLVSYANIWIFEIF